MHLPILRSKDIKKVMYNSQAFETTLEETVRSGSVSARGSVNQVRDFVRGMHITAKTKEAQAVLSAIINEIDKLHPKGEMDE